MNAAGLTLILLFFWLKYVYVCIQCNLLVGDEKKLCFNVPVTNFLTMLDLFIRSSSLDLTFISTCSLIYRVSTNYNITILYLYLLNSVHLASLISKVIKPKNSELSLTF